MKIFELFLPREDLALLKRLLLERWRRYAPRFMRVAFFFMFIVAGATALSAWLMKDVVNLIFVERERSALYWVPAIVIAIFTAKGAASYFQEVILAHIGNRMVAETQTRMFDRLLFQDMEFYRPQYLQRSDHAADAERPGDARGRQSSRHQLRPRLRHPDQPGRA